MSKRKDHSLKRIIYSRKLGIFTKTGLELLPQEPLFFFFRQLLEKGLKCAVSVVKQPLSREKEKTYQGAEDTHIKVLK